MQQMQSEQPPGDLMQQDEQVKRYGGIGRLGYFLGWIGLNLISILFGIAAQGELGAACAGAVVTVALMFVLTVNRLHNIGMSGWWSLLMLVPIANLFIWLRCLVCPEGYQDTRKLDTAGKIILGILIGFLVLLFVLGVVVIVLTR